VKERKTAQGENRTQHLRFTNISPPVTPTTCNPFKFGHRNPFTVRKFETCFTVKKKTVVNKSAPPKSHPRKSKKRKSSLTVKEIDYFKNILLIKRREIIGDVNCIENEALKKSRLDASGDLSSMPIHMADMGTDNFEQEFSLGLMDGERKLLNEINLALQRLIDGKYGICEGTGKEISRPRLEANPWAKYCIEYATMVEKGQVVEGEKIFDDEDDDYDYEDAFEDEDESRANLDLSDFEDMDDKEDDNY
jgi:RNA polymerase-binding protein DksA